MSEKASQARLFRFMRDDSFRSSRGRFQHGKSDLTELEAELKADIHGESSHPSKWMAATAITMLLGFGGMILTMLSRLPHA